MLLSLTLQEKVCQLASVCNEPLQTHWLKTKPFVMLRSPCGYRSSDLAKVSWLGLDWLVCCCQQVASEWDGLTHIAGCWLG